MIPYQYIIAAIECPQSPGAIRLNMNGTLRMLCMSYAAKPKANLKQIIRKDYETCISEPLRSLHLIRSSIRLSPNVFGTSYDLPAV